MPHNRLVDEDPKQRESAPPLLPTDEVRESAKRKPRDLEGMMMVGFFTASAAALLACVPVVAIYSAIDVRTTDDLSKWMIVFTLMSGAVGMIAGLAGGIAGFCGSVGGMLPSALFLGLRLRDKALGVPGVQGMEPAEFAATTAILYVVMYVFAVTLAAIVGLSARTVLERRRSR